jgi:hypothetical protein
MRDGDTMKPAHQSANLRLNLRRVGTYVRSCQTSDGGFFFGRVPPGTARDTFCAASALRLLGLEPREPELARAWVKEAGNNRYVAHPSTVYYLVGAAACLGVPRATWGSWAERVRVYENARGGFGTLDDFDPEVTSELETTYFAVGALALGELALDGPRLRQFVLGYQNPDGGFGRLGMSTLASTFYAVSILVTLDERPLQLLATRDWLRLREARWDVRYIEDLYWLVGALHALGEEPADRGRAARFVAACHHPSGGFSRTQFGIASLECTHMALELLEWLQPEHLAAFRRAMGR